MAAREGARGDDAGREASGGCCKERLESKRLCDRVQNTVNHVPLTHSVTHCEFIMLFRSADAPPTACLCLFLSPLHSLPAIMRTPVDRKSSCSSLHEVMHDSQPQPLHSLRCSLTRDTHLRSGIWSLFARMPIPRSFSLTKNDNRNRQACMRELLLLLQDSLCRSSPSSLCPSSLLVLVLAIFNQGKSGAREGKRGGMERGRERDLGCR